LDPIAAIIDSLAADDSCPSGSPVIVLDDAHAHIRAGSLTRDRMESMLEVVPGTLVAVTAITGDLARLTRSGQGVTDLIQADAIEVPDRLDASDQRAAAARYPSLAEDPWLDRLPALLSRVPAWARRYGGLDDPVSRAVIDAAAGWKQTGMPPTIEINPLCALVASILDYDAEPYTVEQIHLAIAAASARADGEPPWTPPLLHPHTVGNETRFEVLDPFVDWLTSTDWVVRVPIWDAAISNMESRFQSSVAGAISLDSEGARRVLLVGKRLTSAGELERAVTAYQIAIDSHHPDVVPHAAAALGLLNAQLGRTGEAIAAYQVAIDNGHPDAAPASAFNLGSLHEREGRFTKAITAYQIAIDSHHTLLAPMAAVNLGNLHGQEGRPAQAITAYEVVINSHDPEFALMVAISLGSLYEQGGQTAEAIGAYQIAIDSHDARDAPR
jgi:Tetratricopeptide repeat